jgi:protoporphyrinogen oxidase
MRIGIVGGGIAGLTAAIRLLEQGHHIFLFEKDEKLGGLAQAIDFSGNKLDKFYRHIFKSDLDIIDLINELKLTDKLKWMKSTLGFYYEGKIYNFTTPFDLLKFSPLPFFDRIKLGLMALYLKRVKNWKKYENITAKEWIEKYVGKKVYEVVWGPLLYQKFADRAEEIAMAWLYGRISARFKSREKGGAQEVLGYMDGSFEVLINTMEKIILGKGGKIFKNSPVNKIIAENNKLKAIKTNSGEYELDALILTCSPMIIKNLYNWDNDYLLKLNSHEYFGAIALIISLKKSLSKIYWLNVADKNSPFVAVVEHTNFISASNYLGNNIIYLGKYLSTENRLYHLSNEELKDTFFNYLEKINPLFNKKDVIEYKVVREPFAQPVVKKNYSKILLDFRTPLKGVYVANMSQIYPEDRGMSYSVGLGNKISEIIKSDNK